VGKVRQLTGVNAQTDAINNNAAQQAAATKQAADAQQAQLMQSAKAAADQQAQMAARNAAEDKAKDAASAPLATADVQLDVAASESATATRRNRKAAYGRNYTSGGVSI
jgi:hypothetical protein